MNFRSKLEQLKGKRDHIKDMIIERTERVAEYKKDLRRYEQAREIVKEVGLKTQQQLTYEISEVTTTALNAVFDEPYDVCLEFVERRNKTECDIYFDRDGDRIDPYSGGGGPLDVTSFALRMACWAMQSPRTRPTILLDEPFKHLKGEQANRRMLEMVKELSDSLGVQVIMVSDERVSRTATIEATDKLFEVTIKKGASQINVEK